MIKVSTNWTKTLTLDDSLTVLRALAFQHATLAGPQAQQLRHLLISSKVPEGERYRMLCSLAPDYDDPAHDATTLYHTRQALAFFQKLEGLPLPGATPEQTAWETFKEGERQCKFTNEMFRLIRGNQFCLRPHLTIALERARRFIKRVLGPAPQIEDLKLQFGPGATTSIKRKEACPQSKLAEDLTCSRELLASRRIGDIIRTSPAWFDEHAQSWGIDDDGYLYASYKLEVSTGKLQFVPKNALTDRAIDCQPTINTYLQSGIGSYMFERLAAFGLNLRDRNINRRWAALGSIFGVVATEDLSNASGTICYELVKFIVPRDWFELMCCCRCGVTTYRKQEVVLEQFSSMGNGYTFPLESLIFWALAKAVTPAERQNFVNTYGDDIICHVDDVLAVEEILQTCGFTVNRKKSYTKGPFRESCGGDYYLGTDIRPYYQKHLVSGQTLFVLHNFYKRRGDETSAAYVRRLIPSPLKIWGPDGYGDGHLISDQWKATNYWKAKDNRGYCGVCFETFSLLGDFLPSRFPGDYVTPLYNIYVAEEARFVDDVESKTLTHTWQLRMALTGAMDQPNMGMETKQTKGNRPLWPIPTQSDRGEAPYERKRIYTFQRPDA